MRTFVRDVPAALVIALLMLVLGNGMKASAQLVTNTSDSGPGTLRDAINNATNDVVITFAPNLSGATITLTTTTLTINTNLTINASALTNNIQINGNGSNQVFNVASNITVVLNSLTITNGYTGGYGGGITNNGTLTVTDCTLSGNRANSFFNEGLGGAIYNAGTGILVVNNCTLSGNSAIDGGAIANVGGTATVNQSTLSGNSASDYGGGIVNSGTLTVNNCTLSGNSAGGAGGGICNFDTLTVNQSTLTGNGATGGAGEGGGIFNGVNYKATNAVTLMVNQSTLTGNSAPSGFGGGIYNGGTLMTITNTIVAGNSGLSGQSSDIDNQEPPGDTIAFGGANIVPVLEGGFVDIITGPAPITNAPDLAPIGNYGGPTQTLPPVPGSPAIAAGSVAANSFTTDQRGYPRVLNGQIDIGAVELPTIQYTASPTNAPVGLPVQFNCPSVDSDGSVIIQWNWSFGDNTASTDQNPSHAYATVGSFSPGLVVTNSLGLAVPGSGPSITASPTPAITDITLSGTNLVINGDNGFSGLTYYVLTSTNLTLPWGQWTPVATNIWSANGSFNLTVTNIVNPLVPQQFYLLQVP
ncbi:MAG: choice-of-anchor Q domain-containing protein [Verrucomicrobiota bacterium]